MTDPPAATLLLQRCRRLTGFFRVKMAAGEQKQQESWYFSGFFSVFSMEVANIMLNCKPGHTLET